jgi:hypothetical protein
MLVHSTQIVTYDPTPSFAQGDGLDCFGLRDSMESYTSQILAQTGVGTTSKG